MEEPTPTPSQQCIPAAVEAVAAAFSLMIGLAFGLIGEPIIAGVFFTLGLAVYFLVSDPSVRLSVVFALLGVHAGYLLTLSGNKIVLPFIVIEKGLAGASVYPDLAQILLAYEAYRRYTSCRQNDYKPKRDLAPPETREGDAAVV